MIEDDELHRLADDGGAHIEHPAEQDPPPAPGADATAAGDQGAGAGMEPATEEANAVDQAGDVDNSAADATGQNDTTPNQAQSTLAGVAFSADIPDDPHHPIVPPETWMTSAAMQGVSFADAGDRARQYVGYSGSVDPTAQYGSRIGNLSDSVLGTAGLLQESGAKFIFGHEIDALKTLIDHTIHLPHLTAVEHDIVTRLRARL